MDNPYSSSGIDPLSRSEGTTMTPGVLQALAGTKPWVQFCAILGFIFTGFMVLGGIFMMIGGGFMAAAGDNSAMPFAGFPAVLGVIYLVMAFFYFFPSLKLWKYGRHIAALLGSNSMTDLEAALDAQRSFWKFVGILVCVAIALYIVAIILVVALAAGGAMMMPTPAP